MLKDLSEALKVIGTIPETVAPLVGEERVVFGGIVTSARMLWRLASSPVGRLICSGYPSSSGSKVLPHMPNP